MNHASAGGRKSNGVLSQAKNAIFSRSLTTDRWQNNDCAPQQAGREGRS
jgi:hypothetical protein